jgi:hypothetical protein|tara:strand:- start:1344 stop:1748 length:405 start_codon:yes stop_codon:yes gene_type:complete
MSDFKTYNISVPFKNDLELAIKVVKIYSATIECLDSKNKLRKQLVDVLTYYFYKGYNDETKELIRDNFNITSRNLNQINTELTAIGVLIRGDGTSSWKNSHRELTKPLKNLQKYFLEKDYDNLSAMLIAFIKVD